MYIRIISAAFLAPIVLFIVYIGSPIYEILIGLAALIMAQEWKKICKAQALWLIVGLFYIGLPCLALLSLRANPLYGQELLFWLLSIVWAADTGAYFFGRLIGGLKLAPKISPNTIPKKNTTQKLKKTHLSTLSLLKFCQRPSGL